MILSAMSARRIVAWTSVALLPWAAGSAFSQRNLEVSSANEGRVALVIGNSAYKDSPLANPVNDAADVAKALESVGFKVILRRNANTREMRQAIRQFGSELRRAQAGLFYFAGHGVQVRGNNYLLPVGADIENEADAEDLAIDANYALRTMEEAQVQVSIVILDACRNNPFARGFRSSTRGLAQMNAATGSVIAFATAPGSVAADGTGRNGTYTKHLLANLGHPDSDLLKVFQRTRAGVVRETGGKQTPWESTSLVGDFHFRPPTAHSVDPAVLELALWDSVKDSRSADELRAYLDQYPSGRFAGVARARLKPLVATQATTPAARPTPVVTTSIPPPSVTTSPPKVPVTSEVSSTGKPAPVVIASIPPPSMVTSPPKVQPEVSFARCDVNGRIQFKDNTTGCLENYPNLMELTGGSYHRPNFVLSLSSNPASCPALASWTWGTVGMANHRCNERLEATVGSSTPQCKCEPFENIAAKLTKSEFAEFANLFAIRRKGGWTQKDLQNPLSAR